MTFKPLRVGRIDPRTLAAERLQLHYAAWLLASAVHSLLPQLDDDSHTNLLIELDGTTLATHPLIAGGSLRFQLRLDALMLELADAAASKTQFLLPGHTMAAALAWMQKACDQHLGHNVHITQREYSDFPAHPLGSGGAFESGEPAARSELGRYFACGRLLFEDLATRARQLSPVRVWPHHFDLGALLPLGGDDEATIGLGLSPGDAVHDVPYWYCSPYPLPKDATPPLLTGPGHWHTEGLASVLMTAPEWIAAGPDQEATARAWLESGLQACRRMLGR